jgi:hypothetical protein
MKKNPKIKLRLEHETLRTLHTHELRHVEGGNAQPKLPQTGDSRNECCA